MNIPEKIYAHWEKLNNEPRRMHLGASTIGGSCERALWYSFRWSYTTRFPGRIQRLFEFGRQSEARFISELKTIGIDVLEDEAGQFSFTDETGHFGGSMDGVAKIDGDWHVIEFKTHGEKSFKELEKKGVKDSKPQHFAQMQVYMGFSGIKKALYFAENKNTSEIYTEFVDFDQAISNSMMERAQRVINSNEPAERIGTADWYECKWCDAFSVCHGDKVPDKNCRTCINSTPVKGGKWHCTGSEIPDSIMIKGCDQHVFNPHLVPYEPIDGANDMTWIKYDVGHGIELINLALVAFPPVVEGHVPIMMTSDRIIEMEKWSNLK